MILYSRWGKQYRIVCPPPTPKKTPSEAKDAKEAKKQGVTTLDTEPNADQMGVMYHESDLMFHSLLATGGGANSVTTNRTKIFDVFAGIGQHRWTLRFTKPLDHSRLTIGQVCFACISPNLRMVVLFYAFLLCWENAGTIIAEVPAIGPKIPVPVCHITSARPAQIIDQQVLTSSSKGFDTNVIYVDIRWMYPLTMVVTV
jgi:hypothetical protein